MIVDEIKFDAKVKRSFSAILCTSCTQMLKKITFIYLKCNYKNFNLNLKRKAQKMQQNVVLITNKKNTKVILTNLCSTYQNIFKLYFNFKL